VVREPKVKKPKKGAKIEREHIEDFEFKPCINVE
jgi:hypothetical protein